MGKRDRAGSRGKEGGFIVLFSLSTVCLFIYDISSMTGDMARPQGEGAARGTLVTVTQPSCCGSLADYETIAPLPLTPRESAGVKVWLKEGYHQIARKVGP